MFDVTAVETPQEEPRASAPAGSAPPLPSTSVVHPSGDLDLTNAPDLRDALAPLVLRGGDVGVNLANVRFLDAAGVNVLFATANAMGEHGQLTLIDPSSRVRRLLMMIGLTDLIA